MSTESLLIEIGTEELPPKALNRLRLSLAESLTKSLADAGLTHGKLSALATPRRLALLIEDMSDRQPDQNIERRGPAVKAARDEDGNPTKALQGFMRSCGIDDPAQLETQKTDKGEWLMYRATESGAFLPDILPTLLSDALAALPIDRRMRWGSNRTEFVRPVHWAVCLYGASVLPINILGLTADRHSSGHRFMGDSQFTIDTADDYIEACRKQYVMVDFIERQDVIRNGINSIAEEENALLEIDESLLEEVTSLVEWPVPLKGTFDESFLAVPAEVLISAMKEHQRYFHLTDPESGLLRPLFITVSNVESLDPAVVVAGNERVIRPRLSDAAFFFSQDTKTPLDQKSERLASIVFQTELGTYGEKTERITELAAYIASVIHASEEDARRAASLCKADLVSDMVGEFPDLQGIMGGYYARHDGESDDVVKGIEQHYRPAQSGGELPDSLVASCVSLADKIDTMVGLFGIDQPPTGSRDPFALRRQSLGVIRVCIENELDMDLAAVFRASAKTYQRSFSTEAVETYVLERLVGYYGDKGITKDIVDAATSHIAGENNLLKIDRVIHALQSFKQSPLAEQLIAANKRVANLLKKVDASSLAKFDTALAVEPAETRLHQALEQLEFTVEQLASEKLESLAALQQPVDQFFEDVLVMDEDPKLRANRLNLLSQLRAQFLQVADFSLLQ